LGRPPFSFLSCPAAESPQSEEEGPANFQKEDGNLSDADWTLSLRRIDRELKRGIWV